MHIPSLLPRLGVIVLVAMPLFFTGCVNVQKAEEAKSLMPPEPQREFRAAWVATVQNIDWPSKRTISADQQRQEMTVILDKAAASNMNAIILQVRTSCDALYDSKLEPWSEYLTGKQGQSPDPTYDPLKLWVEEAHKRGIELHAWFNPFRAGLPDSKSEKSPTHISKTHPELVKEYNGYLWLDPGEEAARQHTLNVFLDVVKRYDIDGVHIDDYFYPYPANNVEFPDEPSWQKYVVGGGKLTRADWRRDNINQLIRQIYEGIKKEKPWVQFGISPFGIWKPGHPSTVKGFNQYESLYADAKLWLNQGWCDYFTPQLYWKTTAPDQPYRDLLSWWTNENWKGRHIWPGLFTTRINNSDKSWLPQDITDQIEATRDNPGATGNVHFSVIGLTENRKDVSTILKKGAYAEPALVPASPWLDHTAPAGPSFTVKQEVNAQAVEVSWKPQSKESPRVWAVYAKHGAAWKLHLFPPETRSARLEPDPVLGSVTAVTVAAVDRSGNESEAVRAKKIGK